ncbi:hypothetical protein [Prosthecobacter sp.]|uniref:tetratricopeptide repeat protein n=1 Tax=Prosthecobacter sp. TaxID=1965333 RepID=UPI002ABAA270|nr:hypothetical protein [Prosthecobacter sp.]MDZ4405575.1 hypothetical protein [Prosthecobacter sp.]
MSASIFELQNHLSTHPEDWEARLALADALTAEGKNDMAAMIVSLAPATSAAPELLVRAGRHLLPIHPEEALQYATLAMQANEMDAEAALLAAEACRALGDGDEAEKHYLVAAQLDPAIEERATGLKEWIAGNTTAFVSKATVPVKLQVLRREHSMPARDAAVAVAVLADDDTEDATPVTVALPDPSSIAMPAPDIEEAAPVVATQEADTLDVRPKQRRLLGPKLAAAAAAILVHAGLFFLLGIVMIVLPPPPAAEITATTATEQVQEKPETKKIVVPQPTPATAAVARPTTSAMTAAGVSAISLPDFDFKAPSEAVAEVATTDLGSSFSVAFQPKGTVQVNFFGIKSKGRRIAFLIEAERYMLTDPKGGIPAYQIVKEEIASMIGKFGVSTAFNVLMFDHFHLSAFSEKLVPGTTANVNMMRDWLYPVNREFEKIGLAATKYPPLKAAQEIEPIRNKLLQGYMLAIQYALESDVDTVFIITSGWRHMARWETKEEYEKYLKDVRWTDRDEKAWVEAVTKANAWLKKENEERKAKGVPQRVIRSMGEIIAEMGIQVRHKPGPNIDAEEREKQVINAIRAIYSSQGKTKPQINFVLFVGKDEKNIPMQEHFEEIGSRARGGKVRVLQGMAALKNVTGRK